ncbi:hypothetical protein B0I72DRAFT_142429 [Yarrowia lipolytica]|uniref:YALI0E23749p n=3 Tax=Yarrowia lipolytica TaxID=4952 RepID=B5FVF3_YARLI|nr:YALI0E23749p [Yarrowia lipolytica CLIB122]6YJ4_b Chain b, subunit NI9M of protein NADH:Ubiquinone Oxidoreductase (Complex I) [Yarrowia lipolytica]7B0N_b Chain b, subunit NI9M of protein NADH:Ubiquinone Oxidoreductase (Complex I) [Yarrowia lipolytica]7O6Y_g Chain g, subunit NI9M of protein NADH:Ubiquinone Oxidoreductase (Complex I) [Yarrowia lipolytica]7O71_g Chain g, subunit NI9M of protein NADH:Ubiquinone Oxidoreductase (Complex I) [Yarrowia lipolytica]7ZKP_g Chain g, subunit NI9M of prote|eukprot:XP_002143082.1 YALI0E23749p [Yarrowia lipolytica CLIB122]
MINANPGFWNGPFRYLRWSAHNRPHLFFAFAIGIAGPVAALTLTPLRRKYLYPDHSPLPQSYPLPQRAREQLTGFDDE